MQDIFAALVSFFILDPLEGELRTQLARAGIAQQNISQVVTCLQAEGPAVASRAWEDPGWAVTTAVGLWSGATSPRAALAEAAPRCATAFPISSA